MKNENHEYKNWSKEKQDNLFSNYLMDSWSFSKVSAFARNEKAFEMQYLYCQKARNSSSTVAGSAYHEALEEFFKELKKGVRLDVVAMQLIAFEYIDNIRADEWKLQKTTPTIDEAKDEATKNVNAFLTNFFNDINVYIDEIEEVLFVEVYIDDFLTINGVDIPLPCHMKIDLIIRTKTQKIVIIDHKTKKSFSDEKDLRFTVGKQAITYVNGVESKLNLKVDEVWFIENKSSQNRDKSPQLNCFKIIIDNDTTRLYEAMLYEPLKRMLDAISNPDYIYLINENDNFVDKAEIYEFWAQTMMAEITDFNIPDNKKDMIKTRLKKIRDTSLAVIDPKTIKNFRKNAAQFIQFDLTNKDMTKEEKIEHVLRTLGANVKVEKTFSGYSSDTFLLEVSHGTNIASLQRFKLDIASALSVPSIRMMKDLFVHDGKAYLAVESAKVRDSSLSYDSKYLVGKKIPLGMDNFGNIIVWDLENQSTPHILMCGSTGSGKSVSIISTLNYAIEAGVEQVIICDPKFEFTKYNGFGGIVKVYNDIQQIEKVLKSEISNMNYRVQNGTCKLTMIIFDEFADAVANSKKGKELDVYEMQVVGCSAKGVDIVKRVHVHTEASMSENLQVLLQKGRSSGYRIIAATQRASVNVINGDSKVNFPVQICFRVPKELDSKVVIDEGGAESLTGKGDGLIKSPEYNNNITRFQAFYKA